MKSRQASAAATSTSRGRRRLARGVHGLAGTQQRLRRDARPVGALAADQLALDERDAQAAFGERAGAVLARRAAADDDDVVVVAHVGSSSPACSRTMYSAYQSGQFAIGLARSASRARRARPRRASSAFARSLAELNVVSSASTRPGSRAVISCSSQPLPSGIAERGERAVAAVIGRRPGDAAVGRRAGTERPARPRGTPRSTSTPRADERGARRLDVGDDQVQPLRRAGRGRRHARAELDRAARARRRELDDAEVVAGGDVGVEPPPEAARRTRLARSTSETGMTTTSSFMSTVAARGFSVPASLRAACCSSWPPWVGGRRGNYRVAGVRFAPVQRRVDAAV